MLTTPRLKNRVFSVFVLFCVSFLLVCSLVPIFLQAYRPLSQGGNPVAVNKYHIIMSCHVTKRIHVPRADPLSFRMGTRTVLICLRVGTGGGHF